MSLGGDTFQKTTIIESQQVAQHRFFIITIIIIIIIVFGIVDVLGTNFEFLNIPGLLYSACVFFV